MCPVRTPQRGQSFSYDGFSNLWGKSVTKGSATTLSLTISAATNRITSAGYAYDAAGNLTQMPFGGGSQTQTFDHENRVVSLTNANGTQTNEYNQAGQRVKRTAGGATDDYFYGARGELLARYRQKALASGTFFVYEEMFFYFGGQMAARLGPGVNTGTYQLALPLQRDRVDRLGSVGDGSKYFPYGEERTQTANDAFKFATYYRDGITGLDYAQQRYYSSVQGRFLSADPYMASARPENPGGWNRYAYVEGDPVNFVDPEGLVKCGGGTTARPDGTFVVDVFECIGLLPRPGGGGGYGGLHGSALEVPPDFERVPAGSYYNPRHPDDAKIWEEIRAGCSKLPDGRVTGVSISLGGVAASNVGHEIVINYRTGEISSFSFISAGGGWSAGIGASLYTGAIWGLGASNANYGGESDVRQITIGNFTGTVVTSSPSGGVMYAASVGISGNLLRHAVTGVSGRALYSQPSQLGHIWDSRMAPLLGPVDIAIYAAWQLCR